jgi:hypothetical protein
MMTVKVLIPMMITVHIQMMTVTVHIPMMTVTVHIQMTVTVHIPTMHTFQLAPLFLQTCCHSVSCESVQITTAGHITIIYYYYYYYYY